MLLGALIALYDGKGIISALSCTVRFGQQRTLVVFFIAYSFDNMTSDINEKNSNDISL